MTTNPATFFAILGGGDVYASLPHATAVSLGLPRLPRDSRVDVLRGIALMMIFIDHLPDNLLSLVTLHSFGCVSACNFDPLSRGIGVQN